MATIDLIYIIHSEQLLISIKKLATIDLIILYNSLWAIIDFQKIGNNWSHYFI